MNLIQSVSFVSSTTESLRIPSHVLEAAHYFKEYCYEEIHFIIICHHWTLKIGISWRFTEHFAAVFSACRVSTQLPGVPLHTGQQYGGLVGKDPYRLFIMIFKNGHPNFTSDV